MDSSVVHPAFVRQIQRFFGAFAIVSVLAIATIMSADVVCRYFLTMPLVWSQEVIQFLMGLVFLTGLPLAALRGDHVIVDIVSARFTGILHLVARWCAALVMAAYCLTLALYCSRFAARLMKYGDQTDWLGLPWHWVAWCGAVAFAVAAIAGLYQAREDG